MPPKTASVVEAGVASERPPRRRGSGRRARASARRRAPAGRGPARAAAAAAGAAEDRDEKGGRLAGARLGLAGDVPAGERDGKDLLLDRCREDEARLGDPPADLVRQVVGGEQGTVRCRLADVRRGRGQLLGQDRRHRGILTVSSGRTGRPADVDEGRTRRPRERERDPRASPLVRRRPRPDGAGPPRAPRGGERPRSTREEAAGRSRPTLRGPTAGRIGRVVRSNAVVEIAMDVRASLRCAPRRRRAPRGRRARAGVETPTARVSGSEDRQREILEGALPQSRLPRRGRAGSPPSERRGEDDGRREAQPPARPRVRTSGRISIETPPGRRAGSRPAGGLSINGPIV